MTPERRKSVAIQLRKAASLLSEIGRQAESAVVSKVAEAPKTLAKSAFVIDMAKLRRLV